MTDSLPGISYEQLAERVRRTPPKLDDSTVLHAVRNTPAPALNTTLNPAVVSEMVHSAAADGDFNAPTHIVEAVEAVETEPDPASPEAQAWPHLVIEYAGKPLEVRRPDSQALVAFSLVSTGEVSAELQTKVFGTFLRRHLSPASFSGVIDRMLDPDDSGVVIEDLIKVLAELAAEGLEAQ